MKIASIKSKAYRIPLREPMISSKYHITHRELVRTELFAEDGTRGTGWCTTIGVAGLAVARLVNSYLGTVVADQDARNHERVWEDMWQDLHFAGPGGISTLAIATVDIAIWDLRAQRAGLPLWQMLGGSRDTVPAYASAVNLHLDKDKLLAQAEVQLAAGYDTFKLKIGRKDFEADLDRVRAIRGLIGPSRTLLLDINQNWYAGEAVRRCHALAECAPAWIEEPLLSDDVGGHVHVRRAAGIPVALGEQLCNKFEFWNYVRAEAVDILQPNVWKVGGITEWMKIAHMAQCANLPIAPHNSMELSAHLVAAIPNGTVVENIEGGNLADFGVVTRAPEVKDARIQLDDTPGHGVTFDEAELARFELAPDEVVVRRRATHGGL